jgi:hypothetical protein
MLRNANIASRSSRGPVALLQPVCLRCSKSIAKFSVRFAASGGEVDQTCRFPGGPDVACTECTRKHKGKCGKVSPLYTNFRISSAKSQIPVAFHDTVNKLLLLRQAIDRRVAEGQELGNRQDKLDEAQAKYTRALEAFVRRESKHGLGHKPASLVEVGLLLLQQTAAIAKLFESFNDAYRFAVSTDVPPTIS